jgi:hypothetical protein
MTTFARILAELSDPSAIVDDVRHDHSPFHLATLADCASPDSVDSPGAVFLARIARDVAEWVEGYMDANPSERPGSIDMGDAANEIADGAVPIYTHNRWATFVDLAAYVEDVSELMSDAGDDLTAAAGVALYMIAERLVTTLAEELSAALDADDEEDDEEPGGVIVATPDAPIYMDPETGEFSREP